MPQGGLDMKFNPLSLCIVIFILSFTEATQPDFPVLYFSNLFDIQYYNESGNSTRVVFDGLGYGESIECNLCDHMIYWIELPGKIKRGNPNNLSTIETIISSDVHTPRGLAVDWISNNIYFSHIRTTGHGRIEVAKCDGSHRRVLKHDLFNVNVLAVNPITGHLYFSDVYERINRMDLDGNNLEVVYEEFFTFTDVSGIALDYRLNHLYWALNNTDSQVIKYIDMTAWDSAYRGRLTLPTPVEVTVGSNPYEITIINSTLYWTVLRQDLRAGAIYSRHMESNLTTELINSHELSPHDLCSFYDGVHASTSGCAVNNGGCEIFCFSVPNSEGDGTRVKCDCPTGIIIHSSNNQTCNPFPVNYLIFTQVHNDANSFEVNRTEIRMMSLDTSGQYIDVLVPIELHGTESVFVAYDVLVHRVYWTELEPPSIMSALIFDGSDVRPFINSSISHPESLVIDSFAGNLYWIDSGLDRIEVVRLDNSYARKVLFDTDLVQPQGLALDVVNGYMYWTDLNSHKPRVERARMDGSERMILPGVAGASIKQPSNVAVDPLTRHVYWSDVFDDFEKIVKYSDGQEEELGLSGLEDVLGLAVHGSYIYWTDRGNRDFALARADKVSGRSKEALISNVGGFHGLIAVNQSIVPEASGCRSTHVSLAENQLCLPNGNPMPNITCIDNYILNSGECEDTPPFLFFATESKVIKAEDSSDSTGFEQWRSVQELDITGVTALDVDISENKLYWVNSVEKRIYRLSVGESESESECIVCCCLSSPADLAVDWFGRNLYWTDPDLYTIEIAKLDGSERTIFATIPKEMGGPSLVNVDPIRGDLYWSPKSGSVIYRMRMDDLSDDSNPRISVFWQYASNWTVVGMALNYTTYGGYDYIYWVVSNQNGTKRFKKPLGVDQDSSLDSQSDFSVFDMEILGDHIYYIQNGTFSDHIRNDDTSADLLYSAVYGGTGFTDMVFLHHSLQPGVHECSVNNRGCGGNSLCLVSDGVTGVCSCPTLLATVQTQHRGNLFHDCIAVDMFLLLATSDSISYLPVPVDGSDATASPRRLSIGSVGSIRAIAYDPANKSVLWLDSEADNIQSVAVNGSNKWIFSAPSRLETFSMAYDWFGGQLFVTENNGFQIDLVTLNGDNIGSLLKFPENPLMLDKPGEVVFDDASSTLYWTSRSAIDGYGNAIHKMNLNNLNDVNTLNIGDRKIEKLVLDPPFFYWVNREGSDVVIEKCPVNTTTSKLESEVVVIAHGASNIAALTAMRINNQSNAFWYNETDSFIYRYSGTTVVKYMEWHAPGALTQILGYARKDLLQARPCLTVSRPCSHLCLRSKNVDGYECGCSPWSNLQLDGSTCTDHMCDQLQLSCNDGFNGCYPRAYRCDGITHCRNGTDEVNCSCNADEEFTCFNSSGCIPQSNRCNGVPECNEAEDEIYCCEDDFFGCYVDASDSFDPFGGNANRHYYKCLDKMALCDNHVDCVDGSDENPANCEQPATTSRPEGTSGQLPAVTLIVIIVSVVVVIVMVVLLVGVCVTVRWVHKKKQEYNMTRRMMQANNMSMGGIKGYSPPVRTDSQSDYCSEMSGGTHTTHVGNGSNMSPSGEVCFKYRTADPPPPSPDALTEIEDDDLSRLSQPISEYTVPVPPCPSINYDALSGNMSFSVSQSQFPGTIASHYNGMYNQRVGINGRSLGGNLPNPLLMHQQNGSAYYHNNRAPPPHHIYVQTTKNMPTGNGTSKYEQHYPQSSHYHQSVYSRKELDSEAQSETESTLSMNIENPPGVFDENLPRPPPGRPPSPATLCSEYPGAQPMSPETGSTLSGSSDD